MTTSDLVRQLCEKENISISELARRIGQYRQNFTKKLRRDMLCFEELAAIAEVREIIVKSQFATSPKSNFYSGQEEVRRKPVVYTVAAGEMQKTGYVFYRSINGV